MQEIDKGLVSIIIPYYRARNFITETVNSVLSQTYQKFEIILVNDGSDEDDFEAYISDYFPQIIYVNKINNSGVSDTRNIGLSAAKGEFVLFLDSDDILTENFLQARIDLLSKNKNYDFCSGNINLFKNQKDIKLNHWCNDSNDLLRDIILFSPKINTCPSNFIYKREFLIMKELSFNTKLQSTADKYFLIEALHRKGNHAFVDAPKAQLSYRVNADSMSNLLSKNLVLDNSEYYNLLKNSNYIPQDLKMEFNFKMRYILCGAFKQINDWKKFLQFFVVLLFTNPVRFFKETVFNKSKI